MVVLIDPCKQLQVIPNPWHTLSESPLTLDKLQTSGLLPIEESSPGPTAVSNPSN